MIALTHSSINFNQPHINNILVTLLPKKQSLLQFTTVILVFILLYHALFNFKEEREIEIEEEESELIITTSSASKTKRGKKYRF